MSSMFYNCYSLFFIDISNFIINEEKIYLFLNLPNKGAIKMNKDYISKIFYIPSDWIIF